MVALTLDFRKAFLLFDKDGNGRITADELIDVMRSLGQSPTSREVEEMIKKADQDGKTYIHHTIMPTNSFHFQKYPQTVKQYQMITLLNGFL